MIIRSQGLQQQNVFNEQGVVQNDRGKQIILETGELKKDLVANKSNATK